MGGKPNPGTPADQRLAENQHPDTMSPSSGSQSSDTGGGTDGVDQSYDTLMPWAPR